VSAVPGSWLLGKIAPGTPELFGLQRGRQPLRVILVATFSLRKLLCWPQKSP